MKGYTKHRFHQSLKQMYLSKKTKPKIQNTKTKTKKKYIVNFNRKNHQQKGGA